MSDVEPTISETSTAAASQPQGAPTARLAGGAEFRRGRGGRGGSMQRGGDRSGRRSGPRDERVRPEFDHKMLMVRRVARVVAGGRRFSFSVLLALGNRKGSVGVGLGKAGDTALAIEKATKNAKKEMITVVRMGNNSILRQVEAKYSSAIVVMRPAKGKGLIAGSAVRSVLELAGITDINAKILSGSKNKLNISRAAIAALKQLQNQNTRGKIANEPARS